MGYDLRWALGVWICEGFAARVRSTPAGLAPCGALPPQGGSPPLGALSNILPNI